MEICRATRKPLKWSRSADSLNRLDGLGGRAALPCRGQRRPNAGERRRAAGDSSVGLGEGRGGGQPTARGVAAGEGNSGGAAACCRTSMPTLSRCEPVGSSGVGSGGVGSGGVVVVGGGANATVFFIDGAMARGSWERATSSVGEGDAHGDAPTGSTRTSTAVMSSCRLQGTRRASRGLCG